MTFKMLLVEDNEYKRERVLNFLDEVFPSTLVSQAHSFSTGCQSVESEAFDLVLMDISLPTYDRAGRESGGRFRSNGGREIARKIVRRGVATSIIFLTQYEAFSDRGSSLTLAELTDVLAQECGKNFGGLIYFDSTKSAWKSNLEKLIRDRRK